MRCRSRGAPVAYACPVESSHERLAKNEVVFREVNERVKAVGEGLAFGDIVDEPVDAVEFFCECGEIECMLKITLVRAEYEELRTHPARFAVAPSHDIPAIERVVSRNERFWVVEKRPGQDRPARANDPRQPT